MRMISIIAAAVGLVSATALCNVVLNVYESDGITLFDGRAITVGTELKLIVTSDANDCWSGGLFLRENNRNLARLSGGVPDPNSMDWPACHWLDAGTDALVMHWQDSLINGFDLFSGVTCEPGDWFVVDYTAIAPGDPNVGFYEYGISWDDPNEFVTFHQVPAADFNADGIVNFPDYSLLASCWLQEDCTDPNRCGKADLDADGVVDMNDLFMFADDWLWGAPEPNVPGSPPPPDTTPDPNLIYRIVDANGLNEISIDVGQTVTLYVDMTAYDANDVWYFFVEALISDPNAGCIDNTPFDPNHPESSTARILAGPGRWTEFDDWGPGYQQSEGIYLIGMGGFGAFESGHFASFEYTAQAAGDVTLDLMNHETISMGGDKLYPTLEGLLIHQNDPNSQMMGSEMSLDTLNATEQTASSLTPEEMADFLENLWQTDDTLQADISQEDWQMLIDAVMTEDQTETMTQ